MGLTRIPRRTLILAAAIILALGAIVTGVVWSSNTTCTANTYVPGDRDLSEDPTAIIKKDDLARAFGKKFRKYQENPVEGQGVQSNFTETDGTFTVSITEVKGEQAAASWQRLTTELHYPDAPDIGPQTKFRPELVVAVYKQDVFVSAILTGCTDNAPKDGRALRELGRLVHQRVQG